MHSSRISSAVHPIGAADQTHLNVTLVVRGESSTILCIPIPVSREEVQLRGLNVGELMWVGDRLRSWGRTKVMVGGRRAKRNKIWTSEDGERDLL